ncbi:hypothetical protein BTN50_0495 [Candidatus Enterovibrio altilux]|uniref:Uncharacterized protein n=1 Tax=Candidatus Enterovibrio altilux TaxID=1927128 RepID=A0A291B7P8_9GAMM|nr:hypothetical protein BTN50_0495 [Candidatus Enterovibrio luxaltus]
MSWIGHLMAEWILGLQPPMFSTSSLTCIGYNPEFEASD